MPALDGLGDGIEIAGAHFALVLDRGEATLGGRKFLFLQLDEGAHLPACVAMRQIEHAVVERVEAGQSNELELVAIRRDFFLEFGNRGVVQILLPVEAGRAVVSQQLAGELGVDGFGKFARKFQIRLAGFAPHQIGIRRVGQAATDRLRQAVPGFVEAFHGALTGAERAVVGIHIGGQQVGGFGIGTRHDQGRHPHHVGRQTGRGQFFHRLAGGHQHLAAHVTALLHRGQLVFKMHPCGTGFDHRLHQFECIEHAAETGFGIGHDRLQIVDGIVTFGMAELIRTQQGVVDALDHLRHRVGRVQRLVGVHFARPIGIGGHLPARQINRLQAGLDLLHGLIAGECAQCIDEIFVMQRLPQFLGTVTGDGMLHRDGAAQAHHVFGGVAAGDAGPARVVGPVQLQLFGGWQMVFHGKPRGIGRWVARVNRCVRTRAG